jgi:glycosyltransferase involved in cell wall biosynthesis
MKRLDIPDSPARHSTDLRGRACAWKFCGPIFDPSGYAEFARGFVRELARAGIELCLEAPSYARGRPDLGPDRQLFEDLLNRKSGYGVKIINLNPDLFRNHLETGCFNIGFTMFETTRLPARWVQACNEMDGILVPCAWNRAVFEESGVTVPVRVAAPGIDLPAGHSQTAAAGLALAGRTLRERRQTKGRWSRVFSRTLPRWQSGRISDYAGAFKFYSIFQWTERKNPHGLLRAYFAEFRRSDNVCLVLKTYGSDTRPAEQARIAREIAAVRDSMQLPDQAPLLLIGDLLSRDQIHDLHAAGDCFVLPHRAEGFGMPHLEAMSHGNAVIATRFSGNLEFMDAENSILLPYQLCPVAGMGWNDAYQGDMMWAEPDLGALRQAMRQVYADRQYAAGLGRRAREHVRSAFAWSDRARQFVTAVGEIIDIAQSRDGRAARTAAAA